MKRPFIWLAPTSLALAALAVNLGGCGTDAGSGSFDETGSSGSSGASGTSGISSGTSGISSGTSGASGTSGTSGDLGDGAACQAANSRAEKLPLTMLTVFDQSASMGDLDGNWNHKAERWIPVTTAMKAFWQNPSTAGITANLRLFPHDNDKGTSCVNPIYATADVDLLALPDVGKVFESKLVDNPGNLFTPTRAVLEETAKQADALLDADADAKVVILLVTDGKPEQCPGDTHNDLPHAVTAISGKRFKTYVIGIAGQEGLDDNIRALATAGGTGDTPFLIETGNPAATETAFAAAMDTIRSKLASCDVGIPAPPAGKTFNRDQVNVTLTSGAGTVTDLGYDPTCAGAGWKYDDPNTPTKILLCPATCEPVKTDPASKIDVAFGCETRPAGVH